MSGAESRLQEIIPNFRSIQGTRLFRSSRPDRLVNGSNILLLGRVGIKTILDLRSANELKAYNVLDSYYECVPLKTNTPNSTKEGKNDKAAEKQDANKANYLGKHYNTQMVGEKYMKCVSSRLPFLWKILIPIIYIFDKIFGTIYAYKVIVGQVLEKEGCTQQYMDMLYASGEEIAQVLEPLCDPSNVPALICCHWGKDRTGIISAIVQDLCGVDRQTIIEEYAKSEKIMAARGLGAEMVATLNRYGLNPRYAESKKEVMECVLEFIESNYGSAAEYLELHGLPSKKIELIIKNTKL